MSLWLSVVLVSYFILAISTLVDKFFLSKVLSSSSFYVLWVSILSLSAFLVIPFPSLLRWMKVPAQDLSWIGGYWLLIALITGAVFTLALYLLYSALQKGEASRVVPLVGGGMPVIIFIVSYILKVEIFTGHKLIAFIFLLAGSIIITVMPSKKRFFQLDQGLWWAVGASLSFAAFFLLTKYMFWQHSFIDGIVWPRLGTLVVIVVMMFWQINRQHLAHPFNKVGWHLRLGLIANQGLAALGFLGQNYAIKLGGSLSLISALQGLQYVFILIFAALVSWRFPKLFTEEVSTNIIIQKVIALILIVIGLYYSAVI
ncbi:MAG: hypothetical protein V1846_02315 [Candidatus Komeilibacteria bacterium]